MRIYDQSNMGDTTVHDPAKYNRFVPQNGYFNLLTSNKCLPKNPKCKELQDDGSLNDDGNCRNSKVNYVCKSG